MLYGKRSLMANDPQWYLMQPELRIITNSHMSQSRLLNLLMVMALIPNIHEDYPRNSNKLTIRCEVVQKHLLNGIQYVSRSRDQQTRTVAPTRRNAPNWIVIQNHAVIGGSLYNHHESPALLKGGMDALLLKQNAGHNPCLWRCQCPQSKLVVSLGLAEKHYIFWGSTNGVQTSHGKLSISVLFRTNWTNLIIGEVGCP